MINSESSITSKINSNSFSVMPWQIALTTYIPLISAFLFCAIYFFDKFYFHIFNESLWNYTRYTLTGILLTLLFSKNPDFTKKYIINFYYFNIFTIIIWLSTVLILLNLFDSPLLRRLVFFFCTSNVLIITLPILFSLIQNGAYYQKITFLLLIALLFQFTIPGFYFPPFYGGIAGWTLPRTQKDTISLNGLQIVNNNNERIWFTNSIVDPNNFIFRQISQETKKGQDQLSNLLTYYFNLYSFNYIYLKNGKYPSQKIMKTGFPEDNPSRMFNYKNFPPNKVKQMQQVEEVYNINTMSFIKRNIIYSYDFVTKKLTYGK